MKRAALVLIATGFLACCAHAETPADGSFSLALPDHKGQLTWRADGFKIIQSSAKPAGREIGIRGKDQSGHLIFLGFLFLFPEQAPLTSAKCRDGVIEPAKKATPTLKILALSEKTSPVGLPISLATYSALGRDGKTVYSVRGFVATGDICGDLEVYGDSPITADDAVVRKIFASYRFDPNYSPQFDSVFLYAQILYQARMYKAAAPMFEASLAKLRENPSIAVRLRGCRRKKPVRCKRPFATSFRPEGKRYIWRVHTRPYKRRLIPTLSPQQGILDVPGEPSVEAVAFFLKRVGCIASQA
jgi:hypothetical protein